MKIACVYTVDTMINSIEKPFTYANEIPFGISIIITVLEEHGYEVELFVITPETNLDNTIGKYVKSQKPKLFCYTAVTTQYWQVKRINKYVKEITDDIFHVLGGHHASLDSEEVIKEGVFDAICVGEGENAISALAKAIDNYDGNEGIKPINNLWFYNRETNEIIKNPSDSFRQDLDDLPNINRKIWDKFIKDPSDYPAILLGRGCPFKCTYCSNHAMAKLTDGKFVRFRSPQNIISEVEYILNNYDNVSRIYLEVETFGANRKASFAIFDALANFNHKLENKIIFGANLALTSNFMKNEERCTQLLEKASSANLKTINIGLESGSERLRKEVLLRPQYTNEELVRLCKLAKNYKININFFVLIGLPGESLKDYFETVKVARRAQPHSCLLSIFYPYLGTDLAKQAITMGLVHSRDLVESDYSRAERSRSILNLQGFSSRRIRIEYVLFWFRVYIGHWPTLKVLSTMLKSFLRAYPNIYTKLLFLRNNYSYLTKKNKISNKLLGTRIDIVETST